MQLNLDFWKFNFCRLDYLKYMDISDRMDKNMKTKFVQCKTLKNPNLCHLFIKAFHSLWRLSVDDFEKVFNFKKEILIHVKWFLSFQGLIITNHNQGKF